MIENSNPVVAVVDDDLDLGSSVARLLGRNEISAVSYSDPQALLNAADMIAFCCVVSDIQMGEIDGFQFAEALRSQAPSTSFVFMTAWPTTAHAVDAVRRFGGIDYLEKPIDELRLINAVREGLAWSLREQRISATKALFTRREREVFELLVRGHSNKEIADRLAISARTVEDHRSSIVTKTQANGLAQLMALNNGDIGMM